MDLFLLTFFNQTLAHPILDQIMLYFTTVGLAALPLLGLTLLVPHTQRPGGGGHLGRALGGDQPSHHLSISGPAPPSRFRPPYYLPLQISLLSQRPRYCGL